MIPAHRWHRIGVMANEKPASPPRAEEGKAKFDPFEDEGPVLPGVPRKSPEIAAAESRGIKLDFRDRKVMAGGGIGLAVIVLLAWLVVGSSDKPENPSPVAGVQPDVASPGGAGGGSSGGAGVAATQEVSPTIVVLPGSAGAVNEFPQAWSAKRILVQAATGRTPAIIIRLPGGNPNRTDSYWGLLLVSPYGRCELDYLTDLKKIADDYGYRARHPMVVDPCNRSVFDPTRMGDIGGGLARGAVVQGTTLRPPLAMELRVENGRIIVLQTE